MGEYGNQGSGSFRCPVHQGVPPFTVNTMPEGTVKAFADHGDLGDMLAADGGDCEEVLTQFKQAGVDIDALAARLQDEAAKSFVKSWDELMGVISAKSELLKKAS
jgi:transaldolase